MESDDLYRQIISDHARRPRHRGACAGRTHGGRAENPTCGDEIDVQLRLADDGRIAEAAFTGQGCALSQASASLLMTKVRGRSVAEVRGLAALVRRQLAGEALAPEELEALGDLQSLGGAAQFPQRVRCALLAWQALEQALAAVRDEQVT